MPRITRNCKQINLKNNGHSFHYELINITRLFFPLATVLVENFTDNKDCITTTLTGEDMEISLELEGQSYHVCGKVTQNDHELALSRLLFIALVEMTEYRPTWGVLTGIRPIKLYHKALGEGRSPEEVVDYFQSKYLTSPEISKLCIDTAKAEKAINDLSKPDSFSLYIGIPFCPTRCSYCSFVSSTVSSAKALMQPYVERLLQEIEEFGQIATSIGLRLETVYMGGGTPTTLSAEDMKRVLRAVYTHFDCSTLREFTVEAGRPDTIDREKLEVIRDMGIRRISINPQTLSDEVLRGVGRTHTGQDVIDCYHLAREVGFEAINMDLIAGLPGDTLDGFKHSVDQLIALDPENITIHTLTIKRASDIYQGVETLEETAEHVTTEMVEYGRNALLSHGYSPYYLYRQKNTVANLENIGYCKEGHPCLYNVYIMDETHSIFSAGAGGVTKLRRGEELERIRNYKYPKEYIDQYETLRKRKEGIEIFYRR